MMSVDVSQPSYCMHSETAAAAAAADC